MLRKLFLTTAFFGALCIPAVADEESSNAADSSNVQRNDVVLLSNVSEIVGTSRLFRDKRGVSMDLIATGLSPGAAYTAWWVIFNNPSACINATNTMVSEDQRCDSGDLGNPNVKAGLMWATGQQAGDGGVATFSATLPEGDVSGDRPNPALTLHCWTPERLKSISWCAPTGPWAQGRVACSTN